MKLSIQAYRAAVPPEGAPSDATARAVWDLVTLALVSFPTGGGRRVTHRPRKLVDIGSSLLPRSTGQDLKDIETTAMQALTVALDACVCAGRDRQLLYINTVFNALAERWSPTFRAANATTMWEMKETTVTTSRRELLEAGVDLDRIWPAVCDGVGGLYETGLVGGPVHAQGRRVTLLPRAETSRKYERIIQRDMDYHRRPEAVRLLLAHEDTPPLKIDKETVAEQDYDVVHVGEPTKRVVQILEDTRLFLDVRQVRKDAAALERDVRAHPWRRMHDAWVKRAKRNVRDPADFQVEYKAFLATNQALKHAYHSLIGRRDVAVAVRHQIRRAHEHVDSRGHLEIKTAYSKTRNRRFQPQTFWPTEVSSEEDTERTLVSPAREGGEVTVDEDGRRRQRASSPAMYAKHSPRGRWFDTHASGLDIEHDDWEWQDDFAGDRRPLVGVDASSSMYQIVAVALGWSDIEQMLRDTNLKDAIVKAMGTLAARGKFALPAATKEQLRAGAGAITNVSYGAGLGSILKTLRSDPAKYGTRWGTKKSLEDLLDDGAKLNEAIAVVQKMRDEYLTVARAVADAAHDRDPVGGVAFRDPFDGTQARWHAPLWGTKVLPHGAVPLLIKTPILNAKGVCEANYFGTAPAPKGVRLTRPWEGTIKNLIAPALIHALDASFASHVVLKLHDVERVKDIVIVHDCFLVPSDAEPALHAALRAAAEPWFRGLGPFYAVFEDYLGDHPVHGPTIQGWRKKWQDRLDAADAGNPDWPIFNFKDEVTYTLIGSGGV
jgi:hypothetical protein